MKCFVNFVHKVANSALSRQAPWHPGASFGGHLRLLASITMSNTTSVTTGAIFTLDANNAYYIATIPALVGAAFGLLTMLAFTKIVLSKPTGSDHMRGLAEKIHKGSKDFLITEYKFLAVFVLFIFAAVAVMLIGSENKSDGAQNNLFGVWTAIPLLVGSSLSAFAGWRGMVIATQANVRTTAACDPASGGSINEGLKVAFKSGCARDYF